MFAMKQALHMHLGDFVINFLTSSVPFPLKTEALGTPKIWIKLNNIHPAN
jgi:hypothetical protein